MGKRSAFARRPQDKYSTPPEAVLPLLKHVNHDAMKAGRLKWIPGSKHSGKDNAAWFLFERGRGTPWTPSFYGRESNDE